MFRNQITPLRTNVGRPIAIKSISVLDRHPEIFNAVMNDVAVLHSYLIDAETKDYSSFFPSSINIPSWINNESFQAIGGTAKFVSPKKNDRDFSFTPLHLVGGLSNTDTTGAFPNPILIPAEPQYPFESAFIAVLLQPGKVVDPRKLFLEVEIAINPNELLGGICYYGFPFLPHYINKQGESSANHGLPREISISCDSGKRGFIDNENVLTLQEPISHSGVHYLSIEPIKTDKIKIRFSDWPSFITKVIETKDKKNSKDNKIEVQMAYGLLIPSIIPYTFTERTNYNHQVPFGVLACLKPNLKDTNYFHYSSAPTLAIGQANDIDHTFNADYLYLLDTPLNNYMNFSAASITGQKRNFIGKGFSSPEKFISTPLEKNEFINLYLEQSEENNRCVAGFKITIDRSSLPTGTLSCPLIEANIYEIDLPDGVSPVSITDDLEKHKYLTLIFSGDIESEIIKKFLRPSLSRYFLFKLRNKVDSLCQIKIISLELIQSAHVSVTPRSSRIQKIDSVNFRLIGEKFADDYAKLGGDGFSITIETVNAGKKKNVIFSATNLLTLLDSGNARIYSNYRRQEIVKEVSEETVTTHAGSKDIHSTSVNSVGWRRNETGKDVEKFWTNDVQNTPLSLSLEEKDQASILKDDFESYGTSETRTYNEQIGLEAMGEMVDYLFNFFDNIFGANTENRWQKYPKPLYDFLSYNTRSPKLSNGYGWENIWDKGFGDLFSQQLFVGLVSNLILPPSIISIAGSVITELNSIVDWIKGMAETNTFQVPEGPSLNNLFGILNASHIFNGLSLGFNVGASCYVGGGISISGQPFLPSLNYSSVSGTSGNISKQASKTAYNFSQFLNMMYDKSRAITIFEESEMKRKVERSLDRPGTVKERKRGWEVMWQNRYVDIITCKIPLGVTLPASAKNYYDNVDQSIRVRFGGDLINSGIEADVWFDISEETIKEDY